MLSPVRSETLTSPWGSRPISMHVQSISVAPPAATRSSSSRTASSRSFRTPSRPYSFHTSRKMCSWGSVVPISEAGRGPRTLITVSSLDAFLATLRSSLEPARLLEVSLQRSEKARPGGAIHGAMVGRQRGLHDLRDHDGAVAYDRGGSDLTDREDRDLRRHHDGRELRDLEHTEIAQRECRVRPLGGLDLSSFRSSHQVAQAGRDRFEISAVAPDQSRRDESV